MSDYDRRIFGRFMGLLFRLLLIVAQHSGWLTANGYAELKDDWDELALDLNQWGQ